MVSAQQAHPWHGVHPGEKAPDEVVSFIEIVPTDTVKYEVDKDSGLLRLDRPQKFSSLCPTLYGFIPQTYCGKNVAARSAKGRRGKPLDGDGDPLDICVLSERAISHGNILLRAIPIGGFCMIDKGQVDDKIIAVLVDDAVYGAWRDIKDCPRPLIDRLHHYFLSYKNPLHMKAASQPVRIDKVYGRTEAHAVIKASFADYRDYAAQH